MHDDPTVFSLDVIITLMGVADLLAQRHQSSGGHCGTYTQELVNRTGKPWKEVRAALAELHHAGKIKTRPGPKGNLIFIKRDRHV